MQSKDEREQLLDCWLALMEDGPEPDGPIRLPVLSGSMTPGIPVGSTAHIKKTEARHCRRGHVVVYRDKDRLVIHRVLLRLGWGSSFLIYEKGDTRDKGGWIRGSQIRGKMTAVDLLNGEGPQPHPINSDQAQASLKADLKHRMLAFPRFIKRHLKGIRN